MARLRYVEPTDESDELEALAAQILSERGGQLPNLYKMLLHSPPVAAGWLHFGTAVRSQAKLDGRIRELAICKVARLTRAEYERLHHEPIARREGITEQQLAGLDAWREGDLFDTRDRAVLAYAEQMTERVQVDDAVFAAVREHFDDREIVELTATIAFYNLVSRFLVAMQIDME